MGDDIANYFCAFGNLKSNEKKKKHRNLMSLVQFKHAFGYNKNKNVCSKQGSLDMS